MGDRLVIVLEKNGKYMASIYDHWGGEFVRTWELLNEFTDSVKDLFQNANGFANFLSMFVHFYRKFRKMRADEPYDIYLHVGDDHPAEPDPENPIIVIDYITTDKERRDHVEIKYVNADSISDFLEGKYKPCDMVVTCNGYCVTFKC